MLLQTVHGILTLSLLAIACQGRKAPLTPEQDLKSQQTSKQQTSNQQTSNQQTDLADFCSYPESLKKAVQSVLNSPCHLVTVKHLRLIKKITLQGLGPNIKLKEYHAHHFVSLEEIDLSNNLSLDRLPDFVIQIPSLKKLNISKTKITNLDDRICQLENLTGLIGTHNNYDGNEVPLSVFCLSNLKVLDMSHSKIYYIDEYIHKLKNLEELHMANNDLLIVPYVLQYMPKLLLVDFTNNNFENEVINTLQDCSNHPEKTRDECQRELLLSFHCDWWQEFPHKRGEPFRRYKEMTDEEFAKVDARASRNDCYLFWLNTHLIPMPDEEKEKLYQRTSINGKFMREWKFISHLIDSEWMGHKEGNSFWQNLYAAAIGSTEHLWCKTKMKFEDDMSYAVSRMELEPQDYHSPNWNDPPNECKDLAITKSTPH